MTPRGIRNNNPLNIIKSGVDWEGERPGDDAVFEVFDTPEHGIQAAGSLLLRYQTKHGLNTVSGIINRWAPPSENDTEAYVHAVCERIGVAADQPLDLHDWATLRSLFIAMCWQENGQQPYTDSQINAGLGAVLGVAPPSILQQPPAPIEERGTPYNPEQESPMAAPFVVPVVASLAEQLLPLVFKLFAPKTEQKLQKITGADQATVGAFTTELFTKIGQVLSVPDPVNNPVQAVAALQKAPPEKIQEVEDHALDYFERLAPIFEKLMETDKWARETQLAGQAAALLRQQGDTQGNVKVVIEDVRDNTRYMMIGFSIGAVVAVIAKGVWPQIPDYAAMIIPALTLLGGQIMKERGAIVAYYFDGTPTSNAANAINTGLGKVLK